jgi:hypothetical protein
VEGVGAQVSTVTARRVAAVIDNSACAAELHPLTTGMSSAGPAGRSEGTGVMCVWISPSGCVR